MKVWFKQWGILCGAWLITLALGFAFAYVGGTRSVSPLLVLVLLVVVCAAHLYRHQGPRVPDQRQVFFITIAVIALALSFIASCITMFAPPWLMLVVGFGLFIATILGCYKLAPAAARPAVE